MAKRHGLKKVLKPQAITKAVNSIYAKEIISYEKSSKWLPKLNVPETLFIANVLTDFLFFLLVSLMMLTGMCEKGKDEQTKIILSRILKVAVLKPKVTVTLVRLRFALGIYFASYFVIFQHV